MGLDPGAYPTASAYLGGLPEGLDSFADCTVRREVFEPIRDQLPELADHAGLPAALQAFFRGELAERWIPEVLGQVPNLMLLDTVGEDRYLEWSYENSRRLFQRPFVRHLMKLMSPTLIVLGAARRWGTMRTGTTLAAAPVVREDDRMVTVGTVSFPTGLFPDMFWPALSQSFKAALDGARGKDTTVEVASVDADSARFRVSWSA